LLLGHTFLVSKYKYMQPLLDNAFANKYVRMKMNGGVTWSMKRCYNQDKFRSYSIVNRELSVVSCKGVHEEEIWFLQWKTRY
jgi:hypothetical protein